MLSSGLYLDSFILTEAQLLAIYMRAVQLIQEGKTVMSFDGEGTSFSKDFTAQPMDVAREARRALKEKNPMKYGYIAQSCRVFFV